MKEREIKTTNLDEVVRNAKMPRFLYDEVHLDGTSNLLKNEDAQTPSHNKITLLPKDIMHCFVDFLFYTRK